VEIAIHVGPTVRRKNCPQMRGIQCRDAFGDAREMRYARHPYIAVAPGLARRPLHRFVDVLNRPRVNVSENAAGLVRSCDVDDEERVPAANVEIEVARLHETTSV